MHLSSEPKEPAETHNQRTPAYRVDIGAWTVFQQKVFVDVQLHKIHFEYVGVHIFPERPEIMHDALHLDGTFEHTRWSYRLRLDWSQPSDAEFVLFVTIAPLTFPLRNGILTRSECKPVNVRDQMFRGQIDTHSRGRMRLSEVWPICPRPSMQLQPSHHAEDIGARLGDPTGFNVLMGTTGVPK